MKAYERLLKYVKVYTMSDPKSETVPSTMRQFDLAHMLVEEMKELGLKDVRVDDKCYVYGYIPATEGYEDRKAIGLIAHLDTAPAAPGENVNPQIVENYNGQDITLLNGTVISVNKFPHLKELKGRTLITTDGNTLLGADDKAGIAEILTACERIINENIPHGKICVGFTPDEEVGRGAAHFDVKNFGADFAYTIDGGIEGEISYENFNASAAEIEIHGVSVHPGSAKNTMINAVNVGIELNGMLPSCEKPEHTEGYEGFHHLHHVQGTCEKTRLEYIVRDHNFLELKDQLNDFKRIQAFLNSRYGYELVHITMHEQYLNMKDIIKDTPEIVEQVEIAMNDVGLNPTIVPIRGGTDGAMLSYKGLPCPNLGTGGFNCHGPFEFVSITMMKKGLELLLRLIRNNVYAKEDMPF